MKKDVHRLCNFISAISSLVLLTSWTSILCLFFILLDKLCQIHRARLIIWTFLWKVASPRSFTQPSCCKYSFLALVDKVDLHLWIIVVYSRSNCLGMSKIKNLQHESCVKTVKQSYSLKKISNGRPCVISSTKIRLKSSIHVPAIEL
jgi:hypothetical protein